MSEQPGPAIADHVVVFTTDRGEVAAVGPVTHDQGVAYVHAHREYWADGVHWDVTRLAPVTASGYDVLPGPPTEDQAEESRVDTPEAKARARAAGIRVAEQMRARGNIEDLIEASSLGTPEAKALRASVPIEDALRVVARANAYGRILEAISDQAADRYTLEDFAWAALRASGLAAVIAERDRARDVAVALEQELAMPDTWLRVQHISYHGQGGYVFTDDDDPDECGLGRCDFQGVAEHLRDALASRSAEDARGTAC